MVNKIKIEERLQKLSEYYGYLKEYQKEPLEKFSDHTFSSAVERNLQLAIECVIDVGEILISGLKLEKPDSSYEVIMIIAKAGIIPEDFAKKIAPAAGFRNILIHDYLEIIKEEVYKHLQNDIEDFSTFSKYIAEFLEKN